MVLQDQAIMVAIEMDQGGPTMEMPLKQVDHMELLPDKEEEDQAEEDHHLEDEEADLKEDKDQ